MSKTIKSVNSYQGFKENSYAARKGRLCYIKKIHFCTNPPSVTVKMMDNECEVGTEFDRLKPIKSWFCSMCSAENEDINADKCCFCKFSRNYKEKISIKEDSEKTMEPKQNKMESKNVEKSNNEKEMESEDLEENELSDNGEEIESESNIEQSPKYAVSNDDEPEQENHHIDDIQDDHHYHPSFNRPFYNQFRPKPAYRNRARHSFYSPFNAFNLW